MKIIGKFELGIVESQIVEMPRGAHESKRCGKKYSTGNITKKKSAR
tara:strand:+ start:734 stop:871 length:138 start_codon:yes stop_codon:yes gene_type:complete